MNTPPRFLLRIPTHLYDAMIEQARAELPAECCGLLSGRISDDGQFAEVTERYPLVNELKSPTEFVSEPRGMLAAEKSMRTSGIRTLAVYHSHPTSEPKPSKRDLERHEWPGVICMIVGLLNVAPEVRAWWLTGSTFDEARIEVLPKPQRQETPVGVEPT